MPGRIATPLVTAAALAVAVLASTATGAWAGSAPGTPTQVAAGVAASLSIQVLPSSVTPSLSKASTDTAYVDTPSLSNCNVTGTTIKVSKCVYGDTKGTHTMVLWGDSHAFMWFPALNAVAKAAKFRLVALMEFGCPVASVSVWNPVTRAPYSSCNTFRTNMIASINKLKPAVVVMSEAFTSQAANGGGAQGGITVADWQAGLEKTLRALHKTIKKVILGSTISSTNPAFAYPVSCLAANPSHVQKCTISDTAAQISQRASELAATKATASTYVNVLPWTCSAAAKPTACSQVIGTAATGYRIGYYTTGHLTETYSLYLTTVLGNALRPHL